MALFESTSAVRSRKGTAPRNGRTVRCRCCVPARPDIGAGQPSDGSTPDNSTIVDSASYLKPEVAIRAAPRKIRFRELFRLHTVVSLPLGHPLYWRPRHQAFRQGEQASPAALAGIQDLRRAGTLGTRRFPGGSTCRPLSPPPPAWRPQGNAHRCNFGWLARCLPLRRRQRL